MRDLIDAKSAPRSKRNYNQRVKWYWISQAIDFVGFNQFKLLERSDS